MPTIHWVWFVIGILSPVLLPLCLLLSFAEWFVTLGHSHEIYTTIGEIVEELDMARKEES